jgi:hypothetical protein
MVAGLPQIWRYRSDADPFSSDAAWRAMFDHAGYFTWAWGQADERGTRRPLRHGGCFGSISRPPVRDVMDKKSGHRAALR